MKLTLLTGFSVISMSLIISLKAKSFFFNEVQRIKNTIEKINTGKKWLVLIDELFKGTNVQDCHEMFTGSNQRTDKSMRKDIAEIFSSSRSYKDRDRKL